MWKWFAWIGRTVASALLLSFLCIWTTGYIVNSYMESVVKQFDLPLETKPFALSGLWGALWGASGNRTASGENTGTTENTASSTDSDPTANTDPAAKSETTEKGAGTDSTADGTTADPQPAPAPDAGEGGESSSSPDSEASTDPTENLSSHADGAVENDGTKPTTGSDTEGEGAMPATGGSIESGELTEEQRSTLLAKLNADQLQLLADSLKNGLTDEEITRLEQSLRSTLVDSDYKKIVEMLQSIGKSDPSAVPQ